jgi:hypothetical protein
MEAVRSTEICVFFYRTTRGYIPEDSNLQSHRCENLKYKKIPFSYCEVKGKVIPVLN